MNALASPIRSVWICSRSAFSLEVHEHIVCFRCFALRASRRARTAPWARASSLHARPPRTTSELRARDAASRAAQFSLFASCEM